jgi:hypothetical protein
MLSRIIKPTLLYLRQAGLVVLLALYALAAVKVDSFHELFHAQEVAELHSVQQENNPCHKSIYHQAAEAGCEHPLHYTENKKCPLCEYHASGDQLLTETVAAKRAAIVSNQKSFILNDVAPAAAVAHAPRGPPAVV